MLKADHSVLGMHIASPNAGEIIQGFAVAFRKGLVYQVRSSACICACDCASVSVCVSVRESCVYHVRMQSCACVCV